jgi:hypothetical protein
VGGWVGEQKYVCLCVMCVGGGINSGRCGELDCHGDQGCSVGGGASLVAAQHCAATGRHRSILCCNMHHSTSSSLR